MLKMIADAAVRYLAGEEGLFNTLPQPAKDSRVVDDLQQLENLMGATETTAITDALNCYIEALQREVREKFVWCENRPAPDYTAAAYKGLSAVVALLRKEEAFHKMAHSEDLFLYMNTLPSTHAYSLQGKFVLPVYLSRRDICKWCEKKFAKALEVGRTEAWGLEGPVVYLSQILPRDKGRSYDFADVGACFCLTYGGPLLRILLPDKDDTVWRLVRPQTEEEALICSQEAGVGPIVIRRKNGALTVWRAGGAVSEPAEVTVAHRRLRSF